MHVYVRFGACICATVRIYVCINECTNVCVCARDRMLARVDKRKLHDACVCVCLCVSII